MRLRLLPLGLLVAVCAFAGTTSPTPAPWKPKLPAATAKPTGKVPTMIINGIPDTGQFLPDTVWLVKVGPRITRVGDFVQDYLGAYAEYKPAEDSLGRVQFMNNIIHRDLLGLTARALNHPLDFTERATLRETEERALSDVFFLHYVVAPARTRVTDADVEEYMRQRGAEAHFRRIVFADRKTAEEARAAIVGGKLKWADAVKRYSLVKPTPQNPDGDMGWVSRTKLSDEVGLPLFRVRPGEITEVVASVQGGYEISQMVEQRKTAIPKQAGMASYARRSMLEYEVALIADSIQTVIREHIGLAFDTTNVRYASSRFSKSLNVKREGYGTNLEINGEVPEFTPDDTSRVLARWNDGGKFTLGQFLSWYNSMSPVVRPDVTFPDAMASQIAGVVLEPYRSTMARERGLDKDPDVIKRIEDKRERMLVERMYQDSVMTQAWVSREERKAWYDKHLPDYYTFPSVDYAMIYRYNRAGADSIVKALDAGADPAAILAGDSLRGEKTGSLQHMRGDDKSTYRKLLFEELRQGHSSILGPGRDGIYIVFHLIRFDGGRQLSFEESQGMIDESLQNMKAEERLKAWLERLRRKYSVESRPELVMRVKLLDPNGD